MDAFLIDTVQVTQIGTSSDAVNVVGAEAWATLDVRLLPDTDQEAFLQRLGTALGERIDIEVQLSTPPTPASSIETAVYRSLHDALAGEPKEPLRAPVIPSFILGTTDSRYLRQRGIPAYGFSPFLFDADDLRGIHGSDEAIRVTTFLDGVERMRRVVRTILDQCQENRR
jgi:acetylornithine deacetylase/succinyl-diaminopimelate desuccinylase-like protein